MNSSFTGEDLVTTTDPSWNFESFLQNHLETENMGKRRSTTGLLGKAKTVISRNAARERSRVKSLRNAFQSLQMSLPSVPPNTKLSKLDVLILATTYISHLRRILSQDDLEQGNENYSALDGSTGRGSLIPFASDDRRSVRWETSYLHPVRKWPMRSRLYAGVAECSTNVTPTYKHDFPSHRKGFYN